MHMEAIRKIIDSESLDGIISLPKLFRNKKVEITVSLAEENANLPPLSNDDIKSMLKDSITESLIGIIPHSEMSYDE